MNHASWNGIKTTTCLSSLFTGFTRVLRFLIFLFNMKAEHSKTHERIFLLPSHFVKFLAWKYRFSISYARTKMKVNFNGVSLLCQTLILCWINFSRFTLEFIFFSISQLLYDSIYDLVIVWSKSKLNWFFFSLKLGGSSQLLTSWQSEIALVCYTVLML